MKKWLITFSVSLLAAGSAFVAGTPYHEDKANIVEPADDRNPLAEVISGYDFRKSMIREMQDAIPQIQAWWLSTTVLKSGKK